MATDPHARAELVAALRELDGMAAANITRSEAIRERIAGMLARLESGEDLIGLFQAEPHPLIIELVSENIAALQEVGSRLRRAEATALRAQGYTMERIAEMFGVTRQRISALLRGELR